MQKLVDILESCLIKGNSKQRSLQSGFKGAEVLSTLFFLLHFFWGVGQKNTISWRTIITHYNYYLTNRPTETLYEVAYPCYGYKLLDACVTHFPLLSEFYESFEWNLYSQCEALLSSGPFGSRTTSACVWRPNVEVWSCRAFRPMKCPGLRREPRCNKRSASSDATPSSATWSSGGSSCTGGSAARTTPERKRGTRRWVRGSRGRRHI